MFYQDLCVKYRSFFFTWLVSNSDCSSWVASQFGALPWVTEVQDKLFDLFVIQEAISLCQLQQTNGNYLLGLTRTVAQVAFHGDVVLKNRHWSKTSPCETGDFKTSTLAVSPPSCPWP